MIGNNFCGGPWGVGEGGERKREGDRKGCLWFQKSKQNLLENRESHKFGCWQN